jgi:hypothetical protein
MPMMNCVPLLLVRGVMGCKRDCGWDCFGPGPHAHILKDLLATSPEEVLRYSYTELNFSDNLFTESICHDPNRTRG